MITITGEDQVSSQEIEVEYFTKIAFLELTLQFICQTIEKYYYKNIELRSPRDF